MFAGYSHTGPTIINDGMLILNAPTFSSAVTINSPGALGLDGNWVLGTLVSGNGRVVKRGTNVVALSNAGNTYSGGTVVSNGALTRPNV